MNHLNGDQSAVAEEEVPSSFLAAEWSKIPLLADKYIIVEAQQ